MMPKTVYLYQSEGAETDFVSLDPPTRHDLECVKLGVESIYRFRGMTVESVNHKGKWSPVQTAKLIPAPPELESLGPYHGLAD